MLKLKKIFLSILMLYAVQTAFLSFAASPPILVVDNAVGNNMKIVTMQGYCRVVTNNCALPIWIPLYPSGATKSFFQNKPSCVTTALCELPCNPTVVKGYTIGALVHNGTQVVSKTVVGTPINGSTTYTTTARCVNSETTIGGETPVVTCNTNFCSSAGNCVAENRSPDASTICIGDNVTQTNACGATRVVAGTKSCTLGKIAGWQGTVNQHTAVDALGDWTTDPDGVSGYGTLGLTYCKKFWPTTTAIVQTPADAIVGWRGAGNICGVAEVNGICPSDNPAGASRVKEYECKRDSITICADGYHNEGGNCVLDTKTVSCTQAGAPSNYASYIVNNVTITWDGISRPTVPNCSFTCSPGYTVYGNTCSLVCQEAINSNAVDGYDLYMRRIGEIYPAYKFPIILYGSQYAYQDFECNTSQQWVKTGPETYRTLCHAGFYSIDGLTCIPSGIGYYVPETYTRNNNIRLPMTFTHPNGMPNGYFTSKCADYAHVMRWNSDNSTCRRVDARDGNPWHNLNYTEDHCRNENRAGLEICNMD